MEFLNTTVDFMKSNAVKAICSSQNIISDRKFALQPAVSREVTLLKLSLLNCENPYSKFKTVKISFLA